MSQSGGIVWLYYMYMYMYVFASAPDLRNSVHARLSGSVLMIGSGLCVCVCVCALGGAAV